MPDCSTLDISGMQLKTNIHRDAFIFQRKKQLEQEAAYNRKQERRRERLKERFNAAQLQICS